MSNTPNCGPPAQRATGEPDPMFAAIERHRAALRGWLAAYDRLGVLQEMIPEARRRWEIFDVRLTEKGYAERPDDCTDAPEWIEANTAFLGAIEELAKALEVVLSTPPTTIAGIADLLDYLGRCRYGRELVDELGVNFLENAFEISIEGVRKAAANFLPMIAATLRALTAESS